MKMTKDKVFTILVIEDNAGDVEMFLRAVESELPRSEDESVDLVFAARAEGGLKILEERAIDLVITDVRLPGMSGIEFLQRVQQLNRRIPVVVMSWVNAVDVAVEAMRHGAFDYVLKPFQTLDLTTRIHRAMRMAEILRQYRPPERSSFALPVKDLVGTSPAIQPVLAMIDAVAQVSATALIVGETGTGKELIARAIHERSPERDGPFQVVDCTTFSDGMVESELFGHVRGAFTGAVADKRGLIEVGSGGTVFLDEVGDLPLSQQAKLLRVLEEGEVRAVGSTQQKKVNVRFVAATNQNLAEKVKRNEFRKDLFFRLNVMVIQVPPLRERKEDIPLLARHFIQRYAKEFGKHVEDLHAAAVTDLIAYTWPGNVRELRNVIERAVMLAKGDRLGRQEILGLLQPADPGAMAEDYLHLPYAKAKEKVLEDFNRRYLRAKLANHQGNITHAANESGLPRSYFHEIMRRYLKDAN
ncbi:sigma-54-dependent transcriptional regulator [Candidatus Nitrospira bockiana]